ncbi:MAG: DNA modification methylase [Anaerolineales bacterium]|nr:DNA modification methylase [Anaerolineales bacterium]
MDPKHKIVADLLPLATPIDAMHLDPVNARTGHDVERIAASLDQYGQRKPVVVNRSEADKVEAGNGTWQGAKRLGWTHVAAVFVEDDPMTAVGYAIADNRTAELSRWDLETLETLLGSIDPDLGLETGFADGELDELLRAAGIEPNAAPLGEPGDAEPQLDRAEELAAEWGVEPGQMWRLPSRVEGQEHRIVCGDCTDVEVVQRLMAGQRATLFATDPPYLVDYDGTNHPQSWKMSAERQRSINKDWSGTYKDWDAAEQGEALYDGFIAAAVGHAITENAAWYCWHASRRQAMLEQVWERHGAFVHQQVIWFKDRPVLTRSYYMWQHEPCFFGWIRGKKPARVIDEWIGSVWSFPTQTAFEKTDHPTQKPLQLFEIPIRQHTRPGDLVYEPFSGSGTQIVAAENLGRQARAVEIAPAFVAVALDRYLRAFQIRGDLIDG